MGDPGSIPGSGKIPWGKKWQPTPVSLLIISHGRGAWWAAVQGVTESGTIERLTFTYLLDLLPVLSVQFSLSAITFPNTFSIPFYIFSLSGILNLPRLACFQLSHLVVYNYL